MPYFKDLLFKRLTYAYYLHLFTSLCLIKPIKYSLSFFIINTIIIIIRAIHTEPDRPQVTTTNLFNTSNFPMIEALLLYHFTDKHTKVLNYIPQVKQLQVTKLGIKPKKTDSCAYISTYIHQQAKQNNTFPKASNFHGTESGIYFKFLKFCIPHLGRVHTYIYTPLSLNSGTWVLIFTLRHTEGTGTNSISSYICHTGFL